MATGVKPRDEEPQMTRTDLENIQEAMKSKKFRDMFVEYFDEMRDPANQALYQKEMTQLEKERGYDVTWINPKGGYVIKTSVAGDRTAYINICSNENVTKPSCEIQEVDGQQGMNWSLPYTIIPPREDYNSKRERIVLYDVVFHPETLRMAELNKRFRELVNKTAFEALASTYNIHLDSNNQRFPNSEYKGFAVPAVFKTKDPDYKPPTDEDFEQLSPEIIEKLYPQYSYSESNAPLNTEVNSVGESKPKTSKEVKPATTQQRRKLRRTPEEFQHKTDNGYTIPKYVIKQQKNVDLQDFTYNKDCKLNTAIPSQIVIEVNLPMLTSTKDCTLDVQEKKLSLKSEKPAKYKLNISLPYPVNDEMGNAKFDKTKHKLIVTLPVIRNNIVSNNNSISLKADSGVESEENSGSQSDDENSRDRKIVELSSSPADSVVQAPELVPVKEELFFNPSLGYLLPTYTHNVMDDILAFTFHVKNTEPDSVIVKKDGNRISIKFTSIGSGFVPVHYGAIIIFDEAVSFANVTGEAWDNNVILQMELAGEIPQKFQIGLSEDALTSESFEVSHTKKVFKMESEKVASNQEDVSTPVVEVTNLGTETNIVVSSNTGELDEDDDDIESPTAKEEDDEIAWTDPGPVTGAKSILRKPDMMRSFSESSVGDVASSMDYISSDCIPEESSLKKTVRFSDVIARQFYRYNSSIEGQKKKNQRKKSKKRSQDRRKSESEAEDDVPNISKNTKPKIKSALKQRRDSGLADTSDAETECRNEDVASSVRAQQNGNEMIQDPDEVFSEPNNKDEKNSVLDIVNKNKYNKENTEPVIWECDSEAKSSESAVKEKSEPITTDTLKHNTDFYDPNKLNKGLYLEVAFKNDLIFDLDM